MLEVKKINRALPSAYYISDFISEDEEDFLLNQVNNAPKPKWQVLSKRRLQIWGGIPNSKGAMLPEPLPSYILPYFDRIVDLGVFNLENRPNHVLINEYLPGQGIMPHEDGPFYYPVVSTISLGCHTLLDIYRPIERDEQGIPLVENVSLENRYMFSLLLEPRSLVILTEQMYKSCLHGIAERFEDVIDMKYVVNVDLLSHSLKSRLTGEKSLILSRDHTRVSLTIRNVPKVLKIDNPLSLIMKK